MEIGLFNNHMVIDVKERYIGFVQAIIYRHSLNLVIKEGLSIFTVHGSSDELYKLLTELSYSFDIKVR